jgi:hypothetical protein
VPHKYFNLNLNRETDHDHLIIEEYTQVIVRTKIQGQCLATNSIHKFRVIKVLRLPISLRDKFRVHHSNQIEKIIVGLEWQVVLDKELTQD